MTVGAKPKRKSRFGRLLLFLLILVGVVIFAAPFVPLSPIDRAIETRLGTAFGRKVTVETTRLQLVPRPTVKITGMVIDDPAGESPFISSEEVHADLSLFDSLTSRELVLDSLSLTNVRINLVRDQNGIWNWTTRQQPVSAKNSAFSFWSPAVLAISVLQSNFDFTTLRVENGSVNIKEFNGTEVTESLYNNIKLEAALTPSAESSGSTNIKGELIAVSEPTESASLLHATLPFDLNLTRSTPGFTAEGNVGPGAIETKNIKMRAFEIEGWLKSNPGEPLTAEGRLVAEDTLLPTINLSEQVAQALRTSQIGDMSAGTAIGRLETAFTSSQGVVTTTNLQITELDGLGDATAPSGHFKIDSALELNYAANLMLSPDATSRIKSANTLLGVLVTALEINNRLPVPVSVQGDVRQPQIQVDVSRIF